MNSLYYPEKWHFLRQELATLQAEGKTVIFTNGCFDLLHEGHADLLRKSAELGDVLVVGLNSDTGVHRLKGEERPVQTEAERAKALLELDAVDAVAVFQEDIPWNIVHALKPDYITKGGDYAPDNVVGADLVKDVIIFPLKEGFSTTATIQKMKLKRSDNV